MNEHDPDDLESAAGPSEAEVHPHDHPPRGSLPVSTPLELEAAARLFRALADPARLALLELLADGDWCVSEIAAHTREHLSTVSQRLRLLRQERLVVRRRDGKHIHYALADGHVHSLVKSVLEHVKENDE